MGIYSSHQTIIADLLQAVFKKISIIRRRNWTNYMLWFEEIALTFTTTFTWQRAGFRFFRLQLSIAKSIREMLLTTREISLQMFVIQLQNKCGFFLTIVAHIFVLQLCFRRGKFQKLFQLVQGDPNLTLKSTVPKRKLILKF